MFTRSKESILVNFYDPRMEIMGYLSNKVEKIRLVANDFIDGDLFHDINPLV